MGKRLFCELSPTAYAISVKKNRMQRRLRDAVSGERFAERKGQLLPITVSHHASLIRRTLGNVDPRLQENKAVNLSLAAPKVSGILIRPGETFSFWRLVGDTTAKKGYREGLVLRGGESSSGIGGGMCQFTNLIHWMVLHSDLEIVEHHHHDGYDLFPDFGRQVPFGTGTSVFYNYLDYRFYNGTDKTYQLLITVGESHLKGELRCSAPLDHSYHIKTEGERFIRENDVVYRVGEVYRYKIDQKTGRTVEKQLLRKNHARVMYDTADLQIEEEKAE